MIAESLRRLRRQDLPPVTESPTDCLLREVRETRTLEGGIEIYQGAHISLKSVDPSEIYPIAKYILEGNLRFVQELARRFLEQGVDIFDLDHIHRDPTIGVTLAPPIIEVADGVPVIIDGLHRCSQARDEGRQIKVVYIEGVKEEYPPISNPVTWDEVVTYLIRPEDPTLIRDLRDGVPITGPGLRRFYRDFSHLGSSGRRPLRKEYENLSHPSWSNS